MYLLYPPKELVCSCIVPLRFCEQLTQALDCEWDSKNNKANKNDMQIEHLLF